VDARARWQALQARLTAARTSFEAGDRATALAEIDAALDVDPEFLAAITLRERILGATPIADSIVKTGENRDGAENPENLTRLDPATANPEPHLVSSTGYARFEERAKRRRAERKLEAARTAIANRRVRDAASALDELFELDPDLPELAQVTVAFDALRRARGRRRIGPPLAAAAAFAATMFGATWVHQRLELQSHSVAAIADLVAAHEPEPIAQTTESGTPVATSGEREPEPQPPTIERRRPIEIPVSLGSPVTATPAPVRASAIPPPNAVPLRAAAPPPQPAPIATQPDLLQEPMVIAPPRPSLPFVASAAPARATPTIVPTAAPMAPIDTDEVRIKQALQRYRSAYEGLDARSARAVYPAVNEAALARAFDDLESQTLTFDACDVQLHGEGAIALCHGSARYVPKIGSREPRTEPRKWTFALRKAGTDWKIESARAER